MYIIGIDASTTSTGYSVFDEHRKLVDYGVIKPDGVDWRERTLNLAQELKGVLNEYQDFKVVLEEVPLMGKQMKTLTQLGFVQGVIVGMIAQIESCHDISFILPGTWRHKVGLFDGTKQGQKREEMKKKSIEKVNQKFGLNLKWVSPSSKKNEDDIADAILIAYSQIKPIVFNPKQ